MLATVLDRKTGKVGGSPTLYDRWVADIISTADYYPGGMMMPGRNTEYAWSRMGYNGKQKDDEVYGKGNFQDYGLRMYDARISRFISIDPKIIEFPWQSPYIYENNNPIKLVDENGASGVDPGPQNAQKTRAAVSSINWAVLGAMAYSNNFGVKQMWQYAHGYNNCFTCFQGVVGEGLAMQKIEALQTGVDGAWAVTTSSFNPGQNPLGKATTGTWDFKITTKAMRGESPVNLFDNHYGHIDLGTDLPNGGRQDFVKRDFIRAGESFTYYYEVKTLSPTPTAGFGILDGFNQATNTANLHAGEKAASVLLVDRAAWNYAYQNGFAERIQAAYSAFRKAGGIVNLVTGLTNDTKKEMTKINNAVKSNTSNETQ